MPLEYHLKIATDETINEVSELVVAIGARLGLIPAGTTASDIMSGTDSTNDTYILVSQHYSPAWGDMVQEEFRFLPTISILFRLGRNESSTIQGDDVIALSLGLLDEVSGSAILYFTNSGTVWLLRHDGEIILNSNTSIWTENRLRSAPQTHRRESLSFS